MITNRVHFYRDSLSEWIPDRSASILVVGAGMSDRVALEENGYKNATLSDVDDYAGANRDGPYPWMYQQMQDIKLPDDSFDYVVAHAALHHCSSPHRALIEMYRVCRKGIVVVEARDSFVMRLACRMSVNRIYEVAGVAGHQGLRGGVDNSQVPNFIYRWTEREVKKTICTYRPDLRPSFDFRYETQFAAAERLMESSNWLKKAAGYAASYSFSAMALLFPRQQNLFAFTVTKPSIPEGLQPWLLFQDDRVAFNTSAKEINE